MQAWTWVRGTHVEVGSASADAVLALIHAARGQRPLQSLGNNQSDRVPCFHDAQRRVSMPEFRCRAACLPGLSPVKAWHPDGSFRFSGIFSQALKRTLHFYSHPNRAC